jgi:hypothetical protein
MAENPGTPKTGSARKKRRPRKHTKRRRPARKTRLKSHLERVETSLTSAVRETFADMVGAHPNKARPFGMDLKVSIEPGESWQLKADPSIEEQIRAAVREMTTQAEAFRGGSVYCYRCDSSDCTHSHPPRPTNVFGGYSSTGLPVWPEFSQILLERKHPRVDLLYEASQTDLVAMYMDPEMLKQRQLNVFGKQSKTYDILGQVVFGFLKIRVPGDSVREPERVACTLQAVESRRLDGSPRIELNVLARLSDGSPALDAIQGPYQTRVADVISSARHRVSSLRPASKGQARRRRGTALPDTASQVADILRGLARKLEKVGRQRGRRTAHAEGHRIKNRPTSKALEDTFGAPEESVLWDKHEKTFVVLGPRNRVHVFSTQGRHVTSLVLASEAVRSRKRRKRWIPLTADRRKQFGVAISGLAGEEPKGPGAGA